MRTSIVGLVALVPFIVLAQESKGPAAVAVQPATVSIASTVPVVRLAAPRVIAPGMLKAKLDTLVQRAHEATKRDELETARNALAEALALDPKQETRAGILRGLWFVAARQNDVEAARDYRQQYEAMMPTTLTWPGAGCRK